MSTSEQKERFHFLDGLRGIASLMIVVHHAFTSNIARFISRSHIPFSGELFGQTTQSGVDLFFVLSGVVLLRPYLRKNRKLNTGDYFFRRLKRIYPPYFFALLFGALVIWLLNMFPTWYNEKGNKAVFSIGETLKEAFIVSFDAKYYNLAWWSLHIEVLFYIFLDKIVTMNKIVVAIILTLCLSLGLELFFTNYWWQFYSITYNAFTISKCIEYPVCFLLGVFLASRDFNTKQGYQFMVAGIITLITGLVLSSRSLLYMSVLHSGYGMLYAGIIILAFNLEGFKRFLSTPIMIWFGERSYSIFLIHFSVFYITDNFISHFTSDRNAMYGLLTRVIGVPLALFCAMLLFTFVERRQAKGLLTDKKFWPWQVRGMKIE